MSAAGSRPSTSTSPSDPDEHEYQVNEDDEHQFDEHISLTEQIPEQQQKEFKREARGSRRPTTNRQIIPLGADGFTDYAALHQTAAVELLPDLARSIRERWDAQSSDEKAKFKQPHLVIDAEYCLHRLYGAFQTDWLCGGQWTHMTHYLRSLMTPFAIQGINVTVVFDGSPHTSPRHALWRLQQCSHLETARSAYKHVRVKRQVPPRALWLPPACLRSSLTLALRQLDIKVAMTIDDHKQEVMSIVRDRKATALLGGGGEYLVMSAPSPLFLGCGLRLLVFKNRIECRSVNASTLEKLICLDRNRWPLFGALLGNHILRVSVLRQFYSALIGPTFVNEASPDKQAEHREKGPLAKERRSLLYEALIKFVQNIDNIYDLHKITTIVADKAEIFENRDEFCSALKRSVEYYLNATPDHYHQYFECGRSVSNQRRSKANQKSGSSGVDCNQDTEHQMASDTQHDAQTNIQMPMTSKGDIDSATEGIEESLNLEEDLPTPPPTPTDDDNKATAPTNDAIKSALNESEKIAVHERVLEVARRRVAKALMHPWVMHVLQETELRLPAGIDDQHASIHGQSGPLPLGWHHWRMVRQRVYGVLFDLHHKQFVQRFKKEKKENDEKASSKVEPTRIVVKEYIGAPRFNTWQIGVVVVAQPLPRIKSLPTVHSLWFKNECTDKRMRAFLACFDCDNNPILLQHVPRTFLVPCCVLRMMLSCPIPCESDGTPSSGNHPTPPHLLQTVELDAFLMTMATMGTPNAELFAESPCEQLTPRGAHLAHLFMQGIEHAVFTNDACGAPLPSLFCAPWLYFDGKIFQNILHALTRMGATIPQLCQGNMGVIAQIEKMRLAIVQKDGPSLSNLPIASALSFARPPLPPPLAARQMQLALQLMQQQSSSRGRANNRNANLAIQQALIAAQAIHQSNQLMRIPIPSSMPPLRQPPPKTASRGQKEKMPDMTGIVHMVGSRGQTMPGQHGQPLYMQTRAPRPLLQSLTFNGYPPSCSAMPPPQTYYPSGNKPLFTANLSQFIQRQQAHQALNSHHGYYGFGSTPTKNTTHTYAQQAEMQYVYNEQQQAYNYPPVNGAPIHQPISSPNVPGSYAAAMNNSYATPLATAPNTTYAQPTGSAPR